MIEIITAIIGVIGGAVVFEPIIFYSIYRKMKKEELKRKEAETTDANMDNSAQLIEIQEKYINLIESKDDKIRNLQEELLKTREDLIYYKTTHCCKLKCTDREPPLGYDKQEIKCNILNNDNHR